MQVPHASRAATRRWRWGRAAPGVLRATARRCPPGEVRLDGPARRRALRYELEKRRCSACGAIGTAGVLAGVGAEKDSAQACAGLAVSRYALGVPGERFQGAQAMRGGPGPDATQWDQSAVVGDCAYKVVAPMAREAAPGESLLHDDPAGRLVSLLKANRDVVAAAPAQGWSTTNARTGLHTPALVGQVGAPTALLYSARRCHAGENLPRVLDNRAAGRDKPRARADALASQAVADEARLLRCHGLAPGRRQCSDREAVVPHACQGGLAGLSQVCAHDAPARQEPWSPEARLAYPQAQRQPLLDARQRGLDTQSDAHRVEPNSALGTAMGSLQRHGVPLTPCFSGPGAPLDHKLAEPALTRLRRQRNNALFANSPQSASSASVLTSRIATCLSAGVNAVESLEARHEHRSAV